MVCLWIAVSFPKNRSGGKMSFQLNLGNLSNDVTITRSRFRSLRLLFGTGWPIERCG